MFEIQSSVLHQGFLHSRALNLKFEIVLDGMYAETSLLFEGLGLNSKTITITVEAYPIVSDHMCRSRE